MTAANISDVGLEHLLSAERSVLGSMLLHEDAVAEVVAILRPGDFYHVHYQTIAYAIEEAHQDTGQTDVTVVAEVLHRHGQLDDVGGNDALLDLVESVVSA